MQCRPAHRFAAIAAVFTLAIVASAAIAGEITSRMRTVSGVFESNGFRLEPVYDVDIQRQADDLSQPQAFEIIRPDNGKAVTIGRLFTSCSCIQLEAVKRTFQPGERAILQLRNIRPTPANGQVYAIFVQLTGPVRTTLRFDTFVQSGVGIGSKPETAAPAPAAAKPAAAASGQGNTPTGVVGTPVPGVNNELAAALTAINAHPPEATGDLLEEAIAPAVEDAETAGTAQGSLENPIQPNALVLVHNAPTGQTPLAQSEDLAADLGGDLPDFFALPLSETADIAEQDARIEALDRADSAASGTAGESVDPVPAAAEEATRLTEDQILQLQRLALIQAEEQAKQLAERVQQLQAAPAPAPVDQAAAVEEVIVTAVVQPEPEPAVVPAAPAAPEAAPASAPVTAPAYAGRPVQAVSLITIGVRDMSASIRFYEALGWQRAARGKYDQTAFFQLNGQVLALYPVTDLLLEQNMANARPAPGGITLALHVQEKEDVRTVYQRFIDAGGRSLRAPAEMASGAVSSYVADPDGNPWEISWVPQFRIDPNGGLWLP